MTITKGQFEWDSVKDSKNLKKHGISFEEAITVFDDPNAIEFYDEEHSTDEEDRYICLGDVGNCLIVFVIYTDKLGKVRIVSARAAERPEKEVYYEYLKRTH